MTPNPQLLTDQQISVKHVTIADLKPGQRGWAEHWSVVLDERGQYRLNPEGTVATQRSEQHAMFVERDGKGQYLISWNFTKSPCGTYNAPPHSWPTAKIRGNGHPPIE